MAIRMRKSSTPQRGTSRSQIVDSAIEATRKPTRSNAGRFCNINPDHVNQVYLITKTTGSNATQIGRLLGMHPRTVTTYIKRAALIEQGEYTTGRKESDELLVAFASAIKRGMDEFSSGRVENALVRKACGFEYTEVKTEEIEIKRGRGKEAIRAPATRVTRTTKYYAPSDAAIIFWLCNRLPRRWQNLYKQDQTISGTVNVKHDMPADLADNLDRTELETLRRLVAKSAGADADEHAAEEQPNTIQFRRTA